MTGQEPEQPIRKVRIILFCLGFLLAYLFFYWPLFVLTDFSSYPWLIPLCTFVVVPILDAVIGEYRWNWNPSEQKWLRKQVWLRLLPTIAVPAFIYYQVTILGYFLTADNLLSQLGWIATAGIAGGVLAINIAHELIHRKTPWEKRLGGLLLVSVAYGSFKVEHVYGHHTWVATPKDMTTAPKDMTIYQFWWRALSKTPVKAWQISKNLATKKNHSFHELQLLTLASVGFAIGYFLYAGTAGLVYWLAHSLFAILLLETVNYIEHYGLQRKQLDNGKYEPITPMHSWNTSRLFTNYLLFNLQRHSDHHANAALTYPMLRHFDESPQLPQGYATMILLSLIPAAWKHVMNPRLEPSTSSSS